MTQTRGETMHEGRAIHAHNNGGWDAATKGLESGPDSDVVAISRVGEHFAGGAHRPVYSLVRRSLKQMRTWWHVERDWCDGLRAGELTSHRTKREALEALRRLEPLCSVHGEGHMAATLSAAGLPLRDAIARAWLLVACGNTAWVRQGHAPIGWVAAADCQVVPWELGEGGAPARPLGGPVNPEEVFPQLPRG